MNIFLFFVSFVPFVVLLFTLGVALTRVYSVLAWFLLLAVVNGSPPHGRRLASPGRRSADVLQQVLLDLGLVHCHAQAVAGRHRQAAIDDRKGVFENAGGEKLGAVQGRGIL